MQSLTVRAAWSGLSLFARLGGFGPGVRELFETPPLISHECDDPT
jgi:hypothetical protein